MLPELLHLAGRPYKYYPYSKKNEGEKSRLI